MSFKYRADHVGSLLRPPELLQAREQGRGADQLRNLEDRYILDALRRQSEVGLTIFTDGELRRRNFMSDFNDAVDGLDESGNLRRLWQSQGAGTPPPTSITGIVVDRLRQKRRLTAHELPFLQQHAPGDIKVTLPSATQFPAISFKPGISNAAYSDYSALLWDIVPIIKAEIEALAREGVSYIQIDAPRYSYYVDPKWRDYLRNEMGLDPEAALDEAIRADNACLADVQRQGLVLCLHVCRGNNRGQWYAEGGYEPVAESSSAA
jgi:5-methyltetrahydropteroyltriglutamate--homocysteine methyltransferase